MIRHVWVKKNIHVDTVTIIVNDSSMKKLESWVINVNDKKRARQIFRHIKDSYGIDFGIKIAEKDKDLKWLKQT